MTDSLAAETSQRKFMATHSPDLRRLRFAQTLESLLVELTVVRTLNGDPSSPHLALHPARRAARVAMRAAGWWPKPMQGVIFLRM